MAASVGGLRTAVSDGVSGVLVDGHDPLDYARVKADLIVPARRAELARGAVAHAQQFGWSATAAAMLDVYADALVPAEVARSRAAGTA